MEINNHKCNFCFEEKYCKLFNGYHLCEICIPIFIEEGYNYFHKDQTIKICCTCHREKALILEDDKCFCAKCYNIYKLL